MSWLNPAHEDNYYVATATLPWNGQVDAAQMILRRATLARQKDSQPPSCLQPVPFKKDRCKLPLGFGWQLRKWLTKMSVFSWRVLQRWVDRAEDLAVAIAVVEAMASRPRERTLEIIWRPGHFDCGGLVAA